MPNTDQYDGNLLPSLTLAVTTAERRLHERRQSAARESAIRLRWELLREAERLAGLANLPIDPGLSPHARAAEMARQSGLLQASIALCDRVRWLREQEAAAPASTGEATTAL
jgi:hypothetical protein